MTPAQLSRLELGTRNLDLGDWIKILHVLGEKPGDWLENSSSVTPALRPVIDVFAPLPEIERMRLLAMVRAAIEYADERGRMDSLQTVHSVIPYTRQSGSAKPDGEVPIFGMGGESARDDAHADPSPVAPSNDAPASSKKARKAR